MYESLFDEHHKLYKFAPGDYVRGEKKMARPSTGEYEGNLLCKQCDNEIIGGLESYGKQALFAQSSKSPNNPQCQSGITETGIPITRCLNVDYTKFKLFLLSILWRASISTRDFFRDINLGPYYEERIRRMIFDKDAGSEDLFPIIIFSWLTDKSAPSDFVGHPGKSRVTRGIRYVFPIGGLSFVFYVSPESFESRLLPFTVLLNNQVSIFHIPEGHGEKLLASYFDL